MCGRCCCQGEHGGEATPRSSLGNHENGYEPGSVDSCASAGDETARRYPVRASSSLFLCRGEHAHALRPPCPTGQRSRPWKYQVLCESAEAPFNRPMRRRNTRYSSLSRRTRTSCAWYVAAVCQRITRTPLTVGWLQPTAPNPATRDGYRHRSPMHRRPTEAEGVCDGVGGTRVDIPHRGAALGRWPRRAATMAAVTDARVAG